jgi:hypothetical protein
MHHGIMVRSERESTNQIARFWGIKLPIPAISNAFPAGKQTPAQSLRGLFTDDFANVDAAEKWFEENDPERLSMRFWNERRTLLYEKPGILPG